MIHSRLHTIRLNEGSNQQAFADAIGVGKRTFIRYENGERSIPHEVLEKIARMGYNINWLLTGEGEMLITDELRRDEARERELEELRSELKKIATRLEELEARRRRPNPGLSSG